jgi:hypothetical protein
MAWCFICIIHRPLTDHRGRVVGTPALYSGGPGYKSRCRLSLPRVFVVFLCPSRQMLGQYLKLGHDRFFTVSFQCIIRYIIHPILIQGCNYGKIFCHKIATTANSLIQECSYGKLVDTRIQLQQIGWYRNTTTADWLIQECSCGKLVDTRKQLRQIGWYKNVTTMNWLMQ